ncbi:MAG: tetratricopeptide (TPR) repeat protein [Myxococcota bacterium]|jgi:tetratricopeptide (TPR) repeat protein
MKSVACLAFELGASIGSFKVVNRHGSSDTVTRYFVVGRSGTPHQGRIGLLKVARHPQAFLSEPRLRGLSRLLGRTASFSLDPVDIERRALDRCQHPTLPPVYEWGRKDNLIWAITAFYPEFEPATAILAQWDPARVLGTLAACWSGLRHLHARGVVHRDLKLSNLLLMPVDLAREQPDRCPLRFIDFELALVDGVGIPGITGTAAYRSPEQWAAGEVTLSEGASADLHAFGVVCASLLSGVRPQQRSHLEVVTHWRETLARPGRDPWTRDFDPVVLDLIAPDPAVRLAAAHRFDDTLTAALADVCGKPPAWLAGLDAEPTVALLGATGGGGRQRARVVGLIQEGDTGSSPARQALVLLDLDRWGAATERCIAALNESDPEVNHALGRLLLAGGIGVERIVAGQVARVPAGEVWRSMAVVSMLAALVDPDEQWFDVIASERPDSTWYSTARMLYRHATLSKIHVAQNPQLESVLGIEGEGAGGRRRPLDRVGHHTGELLFCALAECLPAETDDRRRLEVSWGLIQLGLAPFVRSRRQNVAGTPTEDAVLLRYACEDALASALGGTHFERDVEKPLAQNGSLEALLTHEGPVSAWSQRLDTPVDRVACCRVLQCGDHALVRRVCRALMADVELSAPGRVATELKWAATCWLAAELGTANWDAIWPLLQVARDARRGLYTTVCRQLANYFSVDQPATVAAQSLIRVLVAERAPGDFERFLVHDERPGEIVERREAAVKRLASGDIAQSLELSRTNLALRSDSPRDWLNAAAALYEAQEWSLCADAALKSIQFGPGLTGGWVYLLWAGERTGAEIEAWLLRESIRRNPTHRDIVHHASRRLLRNGDWYNPTRALERFLATHPTDTETWTLLAEAYLAGGAADAAVRAAENAFRAEPDNAGVRSTLCRAYVGTNKLSEIMDMPTDAEGLTIEEMEARLLAARVLGDTVALAQVAAGLLEQNPRHEAALSAMLSACMQMGRFEDARSFGMKRLDSEPSVYDQLMLAFSLAKTGDDEGSKRLVELHMGRPETTPDLEMLAKRLMITDRPVTAWSVEQTLIGAAVAEAFRVKAWSDIIMWTSHLLNGLAAQDPSFVWRRLAAWLETSGRVAEAMAALTLADQLLPGCVPRADYERLVDEASTVVAGQHTRRRTDE